MVSRLSSTSCFFSDFSSTRTHFLKPLKEIPTSRPPRSSRAPARTCVPRKRGTWGNAGGGYPYLRWYRARTCPVRTLWWTIPGLSKSIAGLLPTRRCLCLRNWDHLRSSTRPWTIFSPASWTKDMLVSGQSGMTSSGTGWGASGR